MRNAPEKVKHLLMNLDIIGFEENKTSGTWGGVRDFKGFFEVFYFVCCFLIFGNLNYPSKTGLGFLEKKPCGHPRHLTEGIPGNFHEAQIKKKKKCSFFG